MAEQQNAAAATADATSATAATDKKYKAVKELKRGDEAMLQAEGDEEVMELEAQVNKQGMLVKNLKKDGAAPEIIAPEVDKLKELKKSLEKLKDSKNANQPKPFDRELLNNVMTRRMFVLPSFEIHGGVTGLFDYGPPGVGLKDNILAIWKNHFVLEENMLQVECTCLTPHSVLDTSGHVDRFTDLMVKDVKTGECYRADKLLEDHIETILNDAKKVFTPEKRAELELIARKADSFTAEEMDNLFSANELNIRSPSTGNELSKSFPFNLMFATTIGPEGTSKGYLRPETAQGIFVLFKRLLDHNNAKTPFAAAQIGLGFRNEIAPRNGLLRVREFCMAEIEHFVHPKFKDHAKFHEVENVLLKLFPRERQLTDGKTEMHAIGDAVKSGMVNNQTLGYFMARTHLFFLRIGIDPQRLRFRQHLETEMAHYASDCWDAEILMSYGWIECVGHADRACYDLEQHSKRTNVELKATRMLPEPVERQVVEMHPDAAKYGKTLKKEATIISAYLNDLSDAEKMKLEGELATNGKIVVGPLSNAEERDTLKKCFVTKGLPIPLLDASPFLQGTASYELTRDLLKFVQTTVVDKEEKFYPAVIEPSFGIGRAIYAVLEHCFTVREEEEESTEEATAADASVGPELGKKAKKDGKERLKRTVMTFPPAVAPIKCGVAPLLKREELEVVAADITKKLTIGGLFPSLDVGGYAIGKKYSKADEIGTPFFITVDPQTLEDQTVTLRERDSGTQLRVPIAQVVSFVRDLCSEQVKFADLIAKFPKVR